eukprot:9721285-Lingulodinium_polyedra.AAC.1
MLDLEGEWTHVGNTAKVAIGESVSAVPAAKGTVDALDVSPFWIVDSGAGRASSRNLVFGKAMV